MKIKKRAIPTAEFIREKNLHAFGWKFFIDELVKLGVIEKGQDVPDEWNQAFLKACRGQS